MKPARLQKRQSARRRREAGSCRQWGLEAGAREGRRAAKAVPLEASLALAGGDPEHVELA